MKKSWIVIHIPTKEACYGLGMETIQHPSKEAAEQAMAFNDWNKKDYVPIEITLDEYKCNKCQDTGKIKIFHATGMPVYENRNGEKFVDCDSCKDKTP
jgi:hypothetical protein